MEINPGFTSGFLEWTAGKLRLNPERTHILAINSDQKYTSDSNATCFGIY